MRTGLLAVLFGLAVCAASTAAGAIMTPAIVDPAMAIAVSLANDSMTDVQSNAALIETAAATLVPPAPKLAAAAKTLRASATIDGARTAFGALNDELVGYMAKHKLSAGPSTKVAICPMVDKPWLQKDGAIRNPYYGSEMLGCGSFKK